MNMDDPSGTHPLASARLAAGLTGVQPSSGMRAEEQQPWVASGPTGSGARVA
jgi:hypothetical protein